MPPIVAGQPEGRMKSGRSFVLVCEWADYFSIPFSNTVKNVASHRG
jgi:hypothetical protein